MGKRSKSGKSKVVQVKAPAKQAKSKAQPQRDGGSTSGVAVYPRLGQSARRHVRAATVSQIAGGRRHLLSGCELLQTVSVPAGATSATGDLVFGVYVGATSSGVAQSDLPSLFNIPGSNTVNGVLGPFSGTGPTTRVGGLMRYWSRFRLRRARLIYRPNVPVTQAGSIMGCYFTDPADSALTSTERNWRSFATVPGAREGPVYETLEIHAMHDDRESDLYVDVQGAEGAVSTSPERRLAFDGSFQMCVSAGIAAGTVLGNVFLDYEIELLNEELPDNAGSAAGVVCGYAIAASGSRSSWALSPGLDTVQFANPTLGISTPAWWNASTGRLNSGGTYGIFIAATITYNVAIQVNASSAYSASVSGLTPLGGGTYPVINYLGTATSNIRGFYSFTAAAGAVVPAYINSASGIGNTDASLGWLQLTIFPLTLTTDVHDVPVQDPVEVRWLQLASAEHVPRIAELRDYLFELRTAAVREPDSFETLWSATEDMLNADLAAGECRAQYEVPGWDPVVRYREARLAAAHTERFLR